MRNLGRDAKRKTLCTCCCCSNGMEGIKAQIQKNKPRDGEALSNGVKHSTLYFFYFFFIFFKIGGHMKIIKLYPEKKNVFFVEILL